MKEDNKLKSNNIIIVLLFIGTVLMYLWTIKLPIIGDGLMHLSDETHISGIKDLIKVFYTFDGLGKPQDSPTLRFHRPIFDELIVPTIKYLTNCNITSIRLISVLVHAINTVLTYYLCYIISKKRYISVIAALMFATSLTYFNGVYEFGLSFSLWLTSFSLLAFIFTIKYEQKEKARDIVLALLASFMAVFTKESAVVLGIALSFYIIIKCLVKNRRINKKNAIYVIAQIVIIILYFVTRYNKLGSIFGIAGGIEGKISLTEAIEKLIGYFFLLLNIPNKVIPGYMIGYLDQINLLLAILFIGLTLIILVYALKCLIKYPIKNINILIGIIMYCILISTTFKVTRNSSYYGDIAMLGILLLMSSLDLSNKKTGRYILSTYIIVYIVCFGCLGKAMINNNQWYLSMGTNEGIKIQNQIIDSIPKKEKVYQTSSWIKDSNNIYTFNHGKIGSFYKFNIDKASEVAMLNELSINNIDNNSLILDYVYEQGTNNIRIWHKMKDSKETSIIKVTYNVVDNYDKILEINYKYDGKVYYQNIDLNYQKLQNNNNTLYFVVPKNVHVNFTTPYIQSVEEVNV